MPRQIISTVTSKGQVTLPVEIRRHLGITTGSQMAFVIEDDGSVHVEPLRFPTIESLAGAAGTLKTPMSWEEIEAVVEEERAEAFLRKRG